MMIHTAKTEMIKLVVEIECVGMNADAFDMETGSSDGLQPEQAVLNCVHALNEPHLHEIHVVPNNSEYFFGRVTPFSSIDGQRSGQFSTDSRIILPCCLFIMYSSIQLFHESLHVFFQHRRRMFSSYLDGDIPGKIVETLIDSKLFDRLHDDDVVSLCCVGILQLVLLGVDGRRSVPDWILRDANVRHWPSLYASQPIDEVDKKRIRSLDLLRHSRAAAWSKKGRFLRSMVFGFFHGNLPVARLTPDDTEARSDWWVSSRAYFDGVIDQAERVPHFLNRQNLFEVPSDFYRDFEE
nr:hypothetical protein [Tanacetum cinerariifolium]